MTHEPDIIFTYGTLRTGLGDRKEAHAFRAAAKYIGPAAFQGKIYAIDWYPGVIDSKKPNDVVIGDLFQINQDPNFFLSLDTYEGCSPAWPEPHEYIRTIRTVLYNGNRLPAWIYLFNWQITDQKLIESGNFADHVQST